MGKQEKLTQRVIDLLNADLDGELGPADKRELQKILAGSAAARAAGDELKKLDNMLGAVPEVEPPPQLQQSIERQVRLPSGHTANSGGRLAGWLSSNWLRAGVALAAGVVLTVGVLQMDPGPVSELNERDVVGTVVQPPQPFLLEEASIVNDLFGGRVELFKSADSYMLRLHIKSEVPIDTSVRYAGLGLEFAGLDGIQSEGEIAFPEDGVIVISAQGAREYGLKLRASGNKLIEGPAALQLRFFANGRLLDETSLDISGR